jgi:hypothetical protein
MASIAVDIAWSYLEFAWDMSHRAFTLTPSSSSAPSPHSLSTRTVSPSLFSHPPHSASALSSSSSTSSSPSIVCHSLDSNTVIEDKSAEGLDAEGSENERDIESARGESDSESDKEDGEHDSSTSEESRWWKKEYPFLFRLSFLRIKILLLQGNFAKMDSIARETLSHIPLPELKLDYGKICHLLVVQKTMQGMYDDAVNEGRKVLNMLLDNRLALPPISADMPFESLHQSKDELMSLNEQFLEKVRFP